MGGSLVSPWNGRSLPPNLGYRSLLVQAFDLFNGVLREFPQNVPSRMGFRQLLGCPGNLENG